MGWSRGVGSDHHAATGLFALGLLTKASAAFALPTAAAFVWAWGAGEPERAEALYRESLERIEAVYGAGYRWIPQG